MIVSIHVPKCAGTSFRHVLDRVYGDRIWYNYGTIFTREQARAELVPAGTTIIHGHFIADSFDDLFPGSQLLTWVRDPVERVVSNYFHFLRSPDMRDTTCQALHERKLDLRGFADLDWMQNLATRYLANKPVDAFQFVGISERFSASMEQFSQIFGLRPESCHPQVNTNPERRTARYQISPDDRAYIRERNAADDQWYREALERLTGLSPSTGQQVA
jgi:Sulfotransferase family